MKHTLLLWQDECNLVGLLQVMSAVFGDVPPVCMKPQQESQQISCKCQSRSQNGPQLQGKTALGLVGSNKTAVLVLVNHCTSSDHMCLLALTDPSRMSLSVCSRWAAVQQENFTGVQGRWHSVSVFTL